MQDTKLKRRDRSTISKREYLINHALYSILLACDLYVILPIIVPIAKYNNSISSCFSVCSWLIFWESFWILNIIGVMEFLQGMLR